MTPRLLTGMTGRMAVPSLRWEDLGEEVWGGRAEAERCPLVMQMEMLIDR